MDNPKMSSSTDLERLSWRCLCGFCHEFSITTAAFCVGLEDLTLVITKSSLIWGMMSCLTKFNQYFRGTYRLHLQGLCLMPASCWFYAWFTLQP